jgi:predicted AAA+ superfamily ATPase
MKSSDLKTVILDQNKIELEPGVIAREKYSTLSDWQNDPNIIIISGLRRCGKSTLQHQQRELYDGYYLNFDDERLVSFTIDDFQQLDELFHELFGDKNIYYFDEIQNIEGWERFIRRLHDARKKIYITGSNARLLSKELGTHLTGRYLQCNLFPFSFKEFLIFKNTQYKIEDFYTTEGKAKLKRAFNAYFTLGGLPEYLKTENREYVKTLYESILYRDVLVRYNISNEKAMKELMLFVLSNVSKQISYNSLKNVLRLKNSTTVKDYFSYLENCYLVSLVSKFSYSLKENIYANKKVYVIDNSFPTILGFRFSDDLGRLLENLVLIELKRRNKEIYYYQEKQECDFVIREGTKIKQALQVCYEISDENRTREYDGLLEAMDAFQLSAGLILTYDQEDDETIDDKKVSIRPVWKWLLDAVSTERGAAKLYP